MQSSASDVLRSPGSLAPRRRGRTQATHGALTLAALGIVFGDIGTSPLYTFKTVLDLMGGKPTPEMTLGAVSLLIWTLIIITSVKYVNFAMRIDNDGEGGILALMSLLGVKRAHRPAIVAIGLFGAALIYGDGAITPAISVLSAVEGLNIATDAFKPYILPVALAILIALFAVQRLGTAQIGRAFGPVMAAWFLVMGILGAVAIVHHPGALWALDPRYGLAYLFSGGTGAFLVLGGVFLCVTGAEALYADMGHFGPKPIRTAWSFIVLPSLLLNYVGQGAIVLDGAPTEDNIFYRLCPGPLLIPLILLATVATIIASQSIITGAFSMTRQAIQLGWLPRLRIKQTSAEGYGQIYVGAVNWLMMVVTVGLTVLFGKSDNLAAAYGIAVSLTMLMTSVLLFIAMREIWRWGLIASGAIAGLFFVIDAAFFAANLAKVLDGGYVPLLLACFVYGLMHVWHTGSAAVVRVINEKTIPVDQFLAEIAARGVPRVPGTAVFLTRTQKETPVIVRWHVKHNRALHERLFVLSVITESTPWGDDDRRLTVTEEAPGWWRAVAHFGFMERPDIPLLLERAKARGCTLHFDDVTYYIGHERVVHRENRPHLPQWEEELYATMARNAAHATDFFNIPSDYVVEIGRQIEI